MTELCLRNVLYFIAQIKEIKTFGTMYGTESGINPIAKSMMISIAMKTVSQRKEMLFLPRSFGVMTVMAIPTT